MDGRGVYVYVIKVPANASFWKRYPYEHGILNTSQPCTLLYIGCTIRSFRARIENDHMRAEYRLKNPSLHYTAVDEPGSEDQWYLLGQAKEDTDQAIIRTTEAAAIASIHTLTLNSPYSPYSPRMIDKKRMKREVGEAKGRERPGGGGGRKGVWTQRGSTRDPGVSNISTCKVTISKEPLFPHEGPVLRIPSSNKS